MDVAGLMMASLMIGCTGEAERGGTPGASASGGPSAVQTPFGSPEPTPEPTSEPTTDPWLPWSARSALLIDQQFAAEIRDTCARTRPAKVATLTRPEWPLDKGPAYRTVQMVVAEVVGPEGPIAALPDFDAQGWQGYARTYRDDTVVNGPDDIELLACIGLRTGASTGYVRNGISFKAYKTSEVVWMVDRSAGKTVGGPWVLGGEYAANDEFYSLLPSGADLSAGDLVLLPLGASFGEPGEKTAGTIVAFLGRVQPEAGTFEQLTAWRGDEDLLLPAGFEVFDPGGSKGQVMYGQTYVVRLVVFEPERVAFAEVFCAPKGTITGKSIRMGADLPIQLGQFEASSAAVELGGDFIYPDEASGTIRGLDDAAIACGVPAEGEWTTRRRPELAARPEGAGYRLEAVPTP